MFLRPRHLFQVALLVAPAIGQEARVDFAAEVRPLLSDRCFPCHGPGLADPAAGLRLDQRSSAVDELGFAAIVPGDAEASELFSRLQHADPERRMPPVSSKLELEEHEVALLRRWIQEGAPYGEHWSFTRPERAARPAVDGNEWVRDELDRFILGGLE
ncbi:MAG: hypothetical protein P8R46_15030, partial [Planctomycetota bacterium]|nr:hypothetical protein [Planctomycetota bacterium]